MAVIPLRLGEAPRQLFALLQPAGGAVPRQHGVLLCNPFGQEAIRAHRLVRVLGDRLAAAGFAVMRFDYFGTGDSDGEDEQGDLETWIDDVLQADEALQRLAGVRERSWFGIRLGASLAALAAERAIRRPTRLILWDPVTDGTAYLEELALAHVNALRQGAAGLEASFRYSSADTQKVRVEDEALGFPLPSPLRRQIAAITPSRILVHIAPYADIIASAIARPSFPATAVRVRRLESAIEWAVDQQMNSAIVPMDAVTAIVDSIEDST